jgi:hypothetical protein
MRKVILHVIVVLFACAALTAQGAAVYEWRDAQGVEHMSDSPPPDDQPGVTMRKIDGQEVNSFSMGVSASDEAAPVASSAPPLAAAPEASPEEEAQCQREYGGPCNWVNNWEDYGHAECARTREARCNDRRYFEDTYRPRRVNERRPGETAGSYDTVRRSADTVHRGGVYRR